MLLDAGVQPIGDLMLAVLADQFSDGASLKIEQLELRSELRSLLVVEQPAQHLQMALPRRLDDRAVVGRVHVREREALGLEPAQRVNVARGGRPLHSGAPKLI